LIYAASHVDLADEVTVSRTVSWCPARLPADLISSPRESSVDELVFICELVRDGLVTAGSNGSIGG
jgi:hypothetical protein